ncbi:hypothetical protein F4141_06840 [Candidatus Poribacteria bacterium]|nr:hypothetical protein [Candidatus Poribacteria bacterium]MYH80407.1 hypothetical protein [Candidatus Poribacteria bacterium]
MLNLFDIPMHDREGFIEALERLEEKTTAVAWEFLEREIPGVADDEAFNGLCWYDIAEVELDLTLQEMMALTTFDPIGISMDAMDMQGRNPLSDVQYLHSLYEWWEVLQKDRETLENLFKNKVVSEIFEEIHTVLKIYSIRFGSIENVHRFCENARREAMDAWLKNEKR